MKDLEQLKEKYTNRHASMLGFEQPEGFSEQSRVLIKKNYIKPSKILASFLCVLFLVQWQLLHPCCYCLR